MTTDFLALLLCGHVIGDYFLQFARMAVNKSKDSNLCAIHCFIYATSIIACTGTWNVSWWLFVYWSHFAVDRFSLADRWLAVLGRGLENFVVTSEEATNYRILKGSFSAIHYVVLDNSIHLISMYAFYRFYFH